MDHLINSDDHEALTELYRRYADRLLGYFIKMFKGDVQKSQDFLQELFIKIWEKKHQFDSNRKFYTWVFTIASNMCKTDFRKQADLSLENQSEFKSKTVNAEDIYDKSIIKKILKEKIMGLEPNHRSAFILRYIEGFTLIEIAEITDANVGTIKSRLFYATKKLAEELKEFKTHFNNESYG